MASAELDQFTFSVVICDAFSIKFLAYKRFISYFSCRNVFKRETIYQMLQLLKIHVLC
jgi:hypothetical protein